MTRVLFVDDEPQVLAGLQRMLRPYRAEFDMRFAEGGDNALSALDAGPADVIVTDMRMPGMDGAALLEIVRDRYPDVVRVILSGQVDDGASLRLAVLAHQFLSKPCEPERLIDTLHRVCALRSDLSDQTLRSAIGALDSLPTPPVALQRLTDALASRDVDADDVLEIIRPEPALTAKLLQLVNSAFFGLPRSISDPREAIVFLGLGMIRDLLAAADVFQSFVSDDRVTPDVYERISQHSTRVADICAFLSNKAADACVAGLLHDIGLLVLAVCRPKEQAAALEMSRRENIAIRVAETELIGTTHPAVGAYMLSLWGFPYETVEAVANHHDALSLDASARLAHIVYVAASLNDEQDVRAGRPTLEAPVDLDPAYLERVGLAERVAAWRADQTRISP